MDLQEVLDKSPADILMHQGAAEYRVENILNKVLGFYNEDIDQDPYNQCYFQSADHYDDSLEFQFFQLKNSKGTTYKTFPLPTERQVSSILDRCGCSQFWINFYDKQGSTKLAEIFCSRRMAAGDKDQYWISLKEVSK